jgi:hypothetical protein
MIRFSDLLAELKDPGHQAARKHRRKGIIRRPYSALPFVRLPLAQDRDRFDLRDPRAVTWSLVPDPDTLEWIDEPYIDATYLDEAGEVHSVFAPVPDARGNVSVRSFCLWQGIPRATEYALTERTASAGPGRARRVKEDPDVPGLHETPGGGPVVNLEIYLKVMVERRTVCWSRRAQGIRDRETLELPPTRNLIDSSPSLSEPERKAPAIESVPAAPRRITPTEELLEYLESLHEVDVAYRKELEGIIAVEREAGEFIAPDVRIFVK